jgi:hypothetical protein
MEGIKKGSEEKGRFQDGSAVDGPPICVPVTRGRSIGAIELKTLVTGIAGTRVFRVLTVATVQSVRF